MKVNRRPDDSHGFLMVAIRGISPNVEMTCTSFLIRTHVMRNEP